MTDPLILLKRHEGKGAVVDSNLLLLLLIGAFNPQLITSFKRTAKYVLNDFERLSRLIRHVGKVITTPHILTETCNLAKDLYDPRAGEYFHFLKGRCSAFLELHQPARVIVNDPAFERVGLTDAFIALLSERRHLVLTDDFALYGLLSSRNRDVININHIRGFLWDEGR